VQASDSGETSTQKHGPCLVDHGQADAVAGDRIAERDVIEVELAGVDGQANGCSAIVTRRNGGDLANGGDDSREHGKAQVGLVIATDGCWAGKGRGF
jgi:hypothetical protein